MPIFWRNMIKNLGDIFSEKFVLSCYTTRVHKPEDHTTNLQQCENPISFLSSSFLLNTFMWGEEVEIINMSLSGIQRTPLVEKYMLYVVCIFCVCVCVLLKRFVDFYEIP